MERKIKAAQKDGGLSRDAAIEEVVADACEMVMGNSKAIERLAKEKPGLAKRIADWLHEFFSDIRKAFEGVEARHEEAKAMLDYMDELTKLWDDALVEAAENRGYQRKKPSINEGAKSVQTKYQLREYSKQQIENWSNSKRIVIYTGETQMRQFIADARGNKADNKKMYFGMVPHTMAKAVLASTGLDVEGFNCSISAYEIRKIFKDHGNQSKEEERGQRAITDDDIVLIPDILLNADKIELSPKLYNGKPAINFVKRGNDRVTVTAYVSDKHLDLVVQTMFANIKKGNLATPTDVQASVNTPEANNGTVSSSIIRNSEPNVKKSRRDTEGNELSQQQQEFFKDSKVRDERGNLKVMYHGTPNGTFTVFNDGTYFTENKEYADLYQNPGASMLSVKKTANAPKTYEVYLNIKKPFDIRDAEARDIYINDYIKGGNAVGINPYMSDAEYRKIKTVDWTEGEDLRDFLIDNGYDYDGLILDEGATGGYGDKVKSRGVSYVIFSADQVKNVDNKNPTSDPDIRFSRRDSAEGLTKEEARAQAAAYTRLKAENAELQRRVEYWKGQTHRTKQATVRQTAPTKMPLPSSGAWRQSRASFPN